MAVENETSTKEDLDMNDHPPNHKDGDKHLDDVSKSISSETVDIEGEIEKQDALELQCAHDIKGKDLIESESFEIQVEDEEAVKDIPDAAVTQRQTNTYAAKKTVAQGMMDIALITANANQLRYIIEFNKNSSTYYLNLFLITVSLLLQVAVGVSLIFKGRLDLRGESKEKKAKKINNCVVVGIFLVTIINVFIASFTITGK